MVCRTRKVMWFAKSSPRARRSGTFLAVVLIGLTALALAACGGDDDDDNSTPNTGTGTGTATSTGTSGNTGGGGAANTGGYGGSEVGGNGGNGGSGGTGPAFKNGNPGVTWTPSGSSSPDFALRGAFFSEPYTGYSSVNLYLELENISGDIKVAPTVGTRFLDASSNEIANHTNGTSMAYAKSFRKSSNNEPVPIVAPGALTIVWGYPDLGSTTAHTQVATVEYTIQVNPDNGSEQTDVDIVLSNLAFWKSSLNLPGASGTATNNGSGTAYHFDIKAYFRDDQGLVRFKDDGDISVNEYLSPGEVFNFTTFGAMSSDFDTLDPDLVFYTFTFVH